MEHKHKKLKREILGRSLIFILLFIAWVGNALLRVVFGYLAASGVQLLDTPVAQSTMNVLVLIFLFLGTSGLIVAVGLWHKKQWGFHGTIIVILATIIFDLWGMTLQFTAAMGFIVPGLVLIYLVSNRLEFLHPTKLSPTDPLNLQS
ncbi:MAG: DUF2127 domain-containing protein [Candidatus Hodarchaeota archaeon]